MSKRFLARFTLPLAGLALVASYAGCGGADENNDGIGSGSGAGTASGGAGGEGGNVFGTGVGGGTGGDDSCASVEQEATLNSRPVDIIVAIDNSGSMGGEIEEVEVQMAKTFASILDGAVPAIDYRVIMVADHGSFNGSSICISQPLGLPADADNDGHCDVIPNEPSDNPPKFFHHSRDVGSHDALCHLYDGFSMPDDYDLHPNGYGELLRDDSYKFFLVITDDNPSSGCESQGISYDDQNDIPGGIAMAAQWDADMLALSPQHFGTVSDRNYTFWSIVSLEAYMPGPSGPAIWGAPHPPDDMLAPITENMCASGAKNPGTGYQALSMLTGGYRYPTCAADEDATPQGDYAQLFSLMAQGVIDGAQIDCEIELPAPPPGETMNLFTLKVKYSSNGTLVQEFDVVDGPGDCNADSFYVDNDTIFLCPGACNTVQSDDNAKLSVSYDCGGPPR